MVIFLFIKIRPYTKTEHVFNLNWMFNVLGNEDEFQRLIVNDVNLNATDENGNSALLLAAGRG